MATTVLKITATLIAALAASLALPAHALQIVSFKPQGEVSAVRQVVAKFDESAVNFGDPKAAAPVALSCSDAQATKGNGRWISDREWAFEFENDLPPGVSCTVQVRSGLKSASGAIYTGATSYKFSSGGPFVQTLRPSPSAQIDEEQYFVLTLNGAATLASVQQNVWCAAEGLGERIAIKLIDGTERTALLKSQGLEKAAANDPLRFVTLACNRRLTPSARVQLVYGKGVSTPSGITNTVEKRFNFQVREPFAASFSCERENAQSACLPIRPMSLNFNAPVPRKLAEAIRLNASGQSLKPTFDADGDAGDGSPADDGGGTASPADATAASPAVCANVPGTIEFHPASASPDVTQPFFDAVVTFSPVEPSDAPSIRGSAVLRYAMVSFPTCGTSGGCGSVFGSGGGGALQ